MNDSHDYDEDFWTDNCEVVIAFVRLCLNAGQSEMCRDVLDAVFEGRRNEMSKLHDFQIPIVRNLCHLLQEFKSSIYTPFRTFLSPGY